MTPDIPPREEAKLTAKRAIPLELIGVGAAMVAVMFAGRIVDLIIIPVVAVASFYIGRLTKR